MTGFQKGQWDMFETITNIYFGKQYYFLESEKEIVYSRYSGKHMSVSDAYHEFIDILKREEV